MRIALRQCYPLAFLVSSTKWRILLHVYCGLHYLFKTSSGGTVPFCLLLLEKCISFLTDAWFYYEAPWWLVNNPPAMKETWFRSLEWEDPLEKRNAKHSGILAWRIPWTVQSDTTEQLSLSLCFLQWNESESDNMFMKRLQGWYSYDRKWSFLQDSRKKACGGELQLTHKGY